MSVQICDTHIDAQANEYSVFARDSARHSPTTPSSTNLASSSRPISTSSPTGRPRFDELPLQPHHPKGSAWGLWGPDDERGTLNLISEDIVRAAGLEVLEGKVVSLK